jgi:hypothetical protein
MVTVRVLDAGVVELLFSTWGRVRDLHAGEVERGCVEWAWASFRFRRELR